MYNDDIVYCENCNDKIKLSIFDVNDLKDKFHLFCKKCIRDTKVCSKSRAKKIFLLSDNEFNNIRRIFIETNNNQQFYLFSDINTLVISKYGSFDNLQKIINIKKEEKQKRDDKIINIKLEREKKIKEAFMFNKLEYKNYGDCYSYIHYGEPSLENVINNELSKLNIKNKRRMLLANELSKLKIPLDENLKSCYEFINGLSSKELFDVVRCIEVEHFLAHNTKYSELCKIHGHKLAQEIAIRQYAENKTLPKNINKSYNKIKLEFE